MKQDVREYVAGQVRALMEAPSCCAEMAKNVAAHAQELKDAGAKYCDCAAILEKKEELL